MKIALTGFSVAYPQDAQTEKEIDEAIKNDFQKRANNHFPTRNDVQHEDSCELGVMI